MSDLIYPISVNVLTGALTYSGTLTGLNITDGSITTADIASVDGGAP